MSGDQLTVRGGSHGTSVATRELGRAAQALQDAASAITHQASLLVAEIQGPIRTEIAEVVRELVTDSTGAQQISRHHTLVQLQQRGMDSAHALAGCESATRDLAGDLRRVAALYVAAEVRSQAEIAAASRLVSGVADLLQLKLGASEQGLAAKVTPVGEVHEACTGQGLLGLLDQQRLIDAQSSVPGEVRVVQRIAADGSSSWVVFIPGTQTWWPQAGSNPADLTTNLAAMSGELTVAQRGVEQALDTAQAQAGRAGTQDPVMVVGHSQGGIIAAALASSPAFAKAHNVRSVVAIASPISGFKIPATVSVMSIAHRDDVVPRLDLARDPDRANWVSVTAATPLSLGSVARKMAGPLGPPDPVAAHVSQSYRPTLAAIDDRVAADRSRGQTSSLTDWADDNARFLGGGAQTVRDYQIIRTVSPPAG